LASHQIDPSFSSSVDSQTVLNTNHVTQSTAGHQSDPLLQPTKVGDVPVQARLVDLFEVLLWS